MWEGIKRGRQSIERDVGERRGEGRGREREGRMGE